MNTRRIYTLLLVLGLVMVWLGFLFTYELKIVDRSHTLSEQVQGEELLPYSTAGEDMQAAGFGVQNAIDGGDAVTETGAGFPLILAGLGAVFVLGGVFSCRNHECL